MPRCFEAVRESKEVSAETPLQISPEVWKADALRLMAETFLEHRGRETGAGSAADRLQVVVHIDQAILAEQRTAAQDGEPHRCELEDGPALALDTARRLACDATVIGIVEGEDGEPLDIGRKTRSIPAAKRAPVAFFVIGLDSISMSAVSGRRTLNLWACHRQDLTKVWR